MRSKGAHRSVVGDGKGFVAVDNGPAGQLNCRETAVAQDGMGVEVVNHSFRIARPRALEAHEEDA